MVYAGTYRRVVTGIPTRENEPGCEPWLGLGSSGRGPAMTRKVRNRVFRPSSTHYCTSDRKWCLNWLRLRCRDHRPSPVVASSRTRFYRSNCSPRDWFEIFTRHRFIGPRLCHYGRANLHRPPPRVSHDRNRKSHASCFSLLGLLPYDFETETVRKLKLYYRGTDCDDADTEIFNELSFEKIVQLRR